LPGIAHEKNVCDPLILYLSKQSKLGSGQILKNSLGKNTERLEDCHPFEIMEIGKHD